MNKAKKVGVFELLTLMDQEIKAAVESERGTALKGSPYWEGYVSGLRHCRNLVPANDTVIIKPTIKELPKVRDIHHGNYGKKRTEPQRARMSEGQRRRWRNQATR